MPSYCVKALENTQSILCGLFLVCEHFCSGRTASHRTALDFRGIFVLLDAGGLSPAKEKRAKSTEKAGCPTCVPLLIDASFGDFISGLANKLQCGFGVSAFYRVDNFGTNIVERDFYIYAKCRSQTDSGVSINS